MAGSILSNGSAAKTGAKARTNVFLMRSETAVVRQLAARDFTTFLSDSLGDSSHKCFSET